VWSLWCQAPDDVRWGLLSRWRPPAELAEEACAAALAGQQARPEAQGPVAEFCVAHGLVPTDPGQQAVFFLLTGQHAQHRAADPDGSVTARAYAAAGAQARRAMRVAASRAGDLDLVRAIVGTGRQRAPLGMAEREYLAGQFAGCREWAALWEVVRDMPSGDAARWLPRFGDGWRPAGRADTALFDLLRRADPQRIAAGWDALGLRPRRFEFGRIPGNVFSAALSGNGQRAAVAWAVRAKVPHQVRICEFDLLTGVMTGDRTISPYHFLNVRLGYVGGDLAVLEGMSAPRNGVRWELSWFDSGRLVPFPGVGLGCPAAGFYPMSSPRDGYALTQYGLPANSLTLHQPDGVLAGRIDLPPDFPYWNFRSFVACGPDGLLGVSNGDWLAVYDVRDPHEPRLVGQHRRSEHTDRVMLCFAGPDRVISAEGKRLSAWRVGASGLEREALSEPDILGHLDTPHHDRCPGMITVQRGDMIAVEGLDSRVAFLDGRTLSMRPAPDWVPDSRVKWFWGCPDGAHWATLYRESLMEPCAITVFRDSHPVSAIVDRVPGQWTPADFAKVAAALADPALPAQARPLVELLRDHLEWRLGGEIRIGQVGSPPSPGMVADDDIALHLPLPGNSP
jgi:hypothetical protein